jgi:formylglycine-generating enzyme required for sulfatase activity
VAVAELARELKSELEWIPLKAMRKDREERYERPVDLARDIENYLAGRPLVAAPESKVYRARKWVRRNRAAVRLALVGVVMLGLGVSIPPLKAKWDDLREVARMNAFEVLAQDPDPAVVTDANARERIKATGKPWKIKHTASGIVMLLCPPGEFLMGSPTAEKDRDSEEVQHMRVIRKAFYLSQNEVSRAEWRAIADDERGDFRGDELPVHNVSWEDIHEDFLAPSLGFFRLPSEAEWEYACRAGTTTAYSFGDMITEEQVCFGSAQPVACGSLPANPWGFHEMLGNVAEWVEDAYADYPKEAGGQEAVVEGKKSFVLNIVSPATHRVLRGGHWDNPMYHPRSSMRGTIPQDYSGNIIGFRVARDPL